MKEIIVNGLVSLGAAFLGAWFAYRFNLKQQKKWDKQRQEEEKKKEREEQILQLSYLQTYLIAYIGWCQKIEFTLKRYLDRYDKLYQRTDKLTPEEALQLGSSFIDAKYRFQNNYEKLYFTSTCPQFLLCLAKVDTGIQWLCSSLDFLNTSLASVLSKVQTPEDVPGALYVNKYNLKNALQLVYSTAASLDEMLQVLYTYVDQNNLKLPVILKCDESVKAFLEMSKNKVKECRNEK